MNKFENLSIDNGVITAVEILKLARESQLKITSKASKNYFKYENTMLQKQATETMKKESLKLDYIEYLIKQLEEN